MKMRINQWKKWLTPVFLLGTFILMVAALHDVQTAEGIGLYLQLKLQSNTRIVFDLLVDVCGMLFVVLFTVLPCICFKRKSFGAAFRFLSVYLAFTPVVSLARLVGMLDGREPVVLREGLFSADFLKVFLEGMKLPAQCLQVGIPLLLLLFMADRLVFEKKEHVQNPVKYKSEIDICTDKKEQDEDLKCSWRKGFLIVQAALAFVGFLFPGLEVFAWFLITYLFFVQTFAVWENILERRERLADFGGLVFAFFWLRGIFRLLELMSIF